MSKKTKSNSRRPGGNPARVQPATVGDWIEGARLRTLPLAIAPILIGTGAAQTVMNPGEWHWVRALAALAVALLLQIGVNYSNDYSDGVRGTDEYRVGPGRLTGSGKAKPRTVLMVALAFFAAAAVVGVITVIDTRLWWLLIVGAAAVVAAWFYTGGKRPYGYYGLGEVFVFLFFGVVAVAGSYFVQVRHLDWEAFALSVPVGLLASGILVVNNVRDIDSDRRAGKRTLAVRLGRERTRVMFALMLGLAFVIALIPWVVGPLTAWVALCWLAAPLAISLVRLVATHTDGPALNGALARSGMLQLVFCVLLSAGVLLSR